VVRDAIRVAHDPHHFQTRCMVMGLVSLPGIDDRPDPPREPRRQQKPFRYQIVILFMQRFCPRASGVFRRGGPGLQAAHQRDHSTAARSLDQCSKQG